MANLGHTRSQTHHFRNYAQEKIPYAIERYTNEVNRLYGVMDARLKDRPYLAGDYSIADMASYPWVRPYKNQGQNLAEFPHLERWYQRMHDRPAVAKAVKVGEELRASYDLATDREAQKVLFGQRARRSGNLQRGRAKPSDHLALAHLGNLVGRAAQPLAIDGLAVDSMHRCAREGHVGFRHPQWPTCHDDRPAHGMVDRLHHAARAQIGIIDELERREHCPARHTGPGDDLRHLFLGALGGPRRDRGIDGRLVLGARGPVHHVGVLEEVLSADRMHQPAPVVFVAPRAENVAQVVEPAGGTLIKAPWRRPHHAVATARQLVMARGLAAHGRAAVVQHRIAHGDLDMLAPARAHALVESGEDAHGAQHAGAGISNRRSWPDGRSVRMAVDAHGAAHGLGDHVERQIAGVRALRRETLDLREDQARVDLAEPRIVEAEPREGAGGHVLDHHVGLRDHPPQQRLALLRLEVARDAALVEVVVNEIMGVGIWTIAEPPSPRLTAVGLLHLDDVGAEPCQRLRARGACLELGEIEHLHALQRRRCAGVGLTSGCLLLHRVSLPGYLPCLKTGAAAARATIAMLASPRRLDDIASRSGAEPFVSAAH